MEELKLLKYPYYPNGCNVIPIKISMAFFHRNRINYPEICMDSQNLYGFGQVAKAILRKDKMLQALRSMISNHMTQ